LQLSIYQHEKSDVSHEKFSGGKGGCA